MAEPENKPAGLGENFSPEDFFSNRPQWDSIETRTHFFRPYFDQMIDEGFLMREAMGPHGHRMLARDPITKEPREVLMFGSNNYLGLANEDYIAQKTIDAIKQWGTGIGGPPLLNGYTSLHKALEQKLAATKGTEDAIVYASGYAANVGWCTALLGKDDYLVFDELSHASLFDGMRMGRFRSIAFKHNDLEDLRQKLMEIRFEKPQANIIVCVEGVYSMDGDIAPLPDLSRVCKKYGALLAIDDAHGIGVTGEKGHGTHEHYHMEGKIDIIMGTFSKTLAATGGFIAGSKEIINYLRFFSRPYMFSASMPTTLVAQVLASLEFLDAHPERVKQLWHNLRYMEAGLNKAGYKVTCYSAIIPIHVPAHVNVRQLTARLHNEGVYVNGISFPAVPKSMQRLRLSMMSTFTEADLDFAIEVLARVGKEFGVIQGS